MIVQGPGDLVALLRSGGAVLGDTAGRRLEGEQLVAVLDAIARQLADRVPVTSDGPPRMVLVDPGGMSGALAILASVFSASTAIVPPGDPQLMSFVTEQHRPHLLLEADAVEAIVAAALERVEAPVRDGAVRDALSGGSLLLPTSGTTGDPKIVPLASHQLLHSATAVAAALDLGPDDSTLTVMPLSHVHGLVASVLAPLCSGGCTIVAPGFRAADSPGWIDRFGISWMSAVPTILQQLVGEAERTRWVPARPLRLLRSASSALPTSLLERLEAYFGCPVIEAYGMTEGAHQIASNRPSDRMPGSVGRPAGCEVTTLGSDGTPTLGRMGELAIRGEQVTVGYLGTAARSEGEWLPTGDLGWIDDTGRVWIHGRSKEVINRSGETISPRSIEDALLRVPGIERAIAFSVPDAHHGEVPAAMVVLSAAMRFDERTIRHALLAHLQARHVPLRITEVTSLPLGRTGKPDRLSASRVAVTGGVGVREAAVGAVADDRVLGLVADAWRVVLGREVRADDSFVDSGGDSLLAYELVAALRDRGLPLTILDVATALTQRRQAVAAQQVMASTAAEISAAD